MCEQRDAFSMVRRGWLQLDVPTGWSKFLALVRRRRSGQQHQRLSQGHRIQAEDGGDEFHSQCPQLAGSRRLNHEALAVARARVFRLEAALEVLGESDSAEVRTLWEVLKQVRARNSAQEHPISAQQGYKRVYHEVNKQKRSEEEQLLENATARLARLRWPRQAHHQHHTQPIWMSKVSLNEMHERRRQMHRGNAESPQWWMWT